MSSDMSWIQHIQDNSATTYSKTTYEDLDMMVKDHNRIVSCIGRARHNSNIVALVRQPNNNVTNSCYNAGWRQCLYGGSNSRMSGYYSHWAKRIGVILRMPIIVLATWPAMIEPSLIVPRSSAIQYQRTISHKSCIWWSCLFLSQLMLSDLLLLFNVFPVMSLDSHLRPPEQLINQNIGCL